MAPKKTVTNKNDKGRRMEANIVRRIVKREQKQNAGRKDLPTYGKKKKKKKQTFFFFRRAFVRASRREK